ncbi:hypothetical protein VTJ04DRAFT_303 [Mycothermus thermophilus]|uniref:uncharacterized protein n=1 Tax=Humicola insolens TaxID=85995 RepID=UPI0037443840
MDSSPSACAESVRTAVASVSTCTPTTVVLLKNLLLPRDDPSSPSDETTARGAVKTTASSRSRADPTKGPSKRAKPTSSLTDSGLSIREKAALATHVVNATLKALGEAAKPAPPPTPSRAATGDDLVKTATRNALRRSSSAPMTPLKPRVLNRQATPPGSPRQQAQCRSPSKSSSSASTGLLATVECARVALTALRQLPASGKVSLPELQLESGMSALIGRLISLNLQEQALRELRVLKRRLEVLPGSDAKKASKAAGSESKTTAQVFAELLDFSAVKVSGQRLLLVVTTQIQTLRVLAMSKKPSAIEAALPFLRHDYSTSPTNLLLSAAKENGADMSKLARQMETLAQCLLALAPSVSTKDDAAAQESRLSISPASALELQALALEARLHWWTLAKHKGDADKDIMAPLSRCIAAYVRRTSESPRSSYAVCSQVFDRLLKQLQSHGFRPASGSKQPLAGLCQTLATLARDAQQISDAIMWGTKLRDAVDPTAESVAKTLSLAAQLLALHLRQPAKYLNNSDLLDQVTAGIQGPLRGDTAELDELLANICLVRKAAVHLLLPTLRGSGNDNSTSYNPPPAIREQLETFILQCPRFCLRWLGKPPAKPSSTGNANTNTKDYLRHEQRRQLLSNHLHPVLDSAFLILKSRLDTARLPWDSVDPLLTDCGTLLEYATPTANSGRAEDKKDPSASYHVKMSHFYYLLHTHLRQTVSDPAKDPAPLRALRKSVDCVRHRSAAEKDKAQLVLKLERLADLCRAAGRVEEAMAALQEVRGSLVEDGVLAIVAKGLDTASPAVVWKRGGDKVQALARALAAAGKMESVWVDWTVDLEEGERAAVLEHRYRLGLGLAGVGAGLGEPVVETLLGIYTPEKCPVRRTRVLLGLLCAAVGEEGEQGRKVGRLVEMVEEVWKVCKEGRDLGMDGGLKGFLQHFAALRKALMAAAAGYRDEKAVEQAVEEWKGIVSVAKDTVALEATVDDIPALMEYLQSLSDFLRMKGREALLASVLELMADISRLADAPAVEEKVQIGADLALQYTALGQSAKAEEMFIKTLQAEEESAVRPEVVAYCHLAFAEHLAVLGNFRQAEHHLAQAQGVFGSLDVACPNKQLRMERRRLAAYAAYLHSLVALERGESHHALVCSRDSVRTLFQDWAKLEMKAKKGHSQSTTAIVAAETSQLDNGPSNATTMDVSSLELRQSTNNNTTTITAGPEFWRLFRPLHRHVLRLSSLYAHMGMFQETMYYAEQAYKMAETVDSELYRAECAAWIAAVSWRAADAGRAASMLHHATAALLSHESASVRSCAAAEVVRQMAALYLASGDVEGAEPLLERAEGMVKELAAGSVVTGKEDGQSETAVVETKMAKLSITGKTTRGGRKTAAPAKTTTARRAGKTTTAARTKAAAAAAAAVSTTTTQSPAPSTPEDAQISRLRAAILVQRAVSMLQKREWAAAQTALSEATTSSTAASSKANVLLPAKVAMASCLLGMSMDQMARDPVFSVIQDSTISFPALMGMGGLGGAERGSPAGKSSPKKARGVVPTTNAAVAAMDTNSAAAYVDALREAHEYLLEAHSVAALSGDASLVHRISGMLQNVGLFLTATSTSPAARVKSTTAAAAAVTNYSAHTAYAVELARNLTWRRERKALLYEKKVSNKSEMGLVSSALTHAASAAARRSSLGLALDLHRMQRDYIDAVLPRHWTVVSLSLSDNQHDLCVTRLQAGHSPFVLRLPLERSGASRDGEEDDEDDQEQGPFDFRRGCAELKEIVQEINRTCHDSRDMTVRGNKAAWWAEREALDQRLKGLCENIESLWLGGFRGVFSQHKRRPKLLARFQKDFLGILDKHLPSRSRQGFGRGKKQAKKGSAAAAAQAADSDSAKVTLDPNVLELFIGLGDPSRPGCELEDELMDLLYFVVDMLQFCGERNAYDEIDFDSMVIETMDALTAYHAAAAAEAGYTDDEDDDDGEEDPIDKTATPHTILILDKALHAFPWESLPCMQGLAVSRVPSLACLRQLLIDRRRNNSNNNGSKAQKGHTIPRSTARGTYILNPSGDLVSTQQTFGGPLAANLAGASWKAVVNRPPSESEFAAALEESDVLLYFGHGSGAQYIRGRTVRCLAAGGAGNVATSEAAGAGATATAAMDGEDPSAAGNKTNVEKSSTSSTTSRCRATVLLMGCSSAALSAPGEFEPSGPVWNYMMAGAPAVVGTLWDVTDREVDRFAGGVLEEWGLVPRGCFSSSSDSSSKDRKGKRKNGGGDGKEFGEASLVEAVTRARERCRFRYVTAAATVVYGVPVYVEK